jgi:hypothetical protein
MNAPPFAAPWDVPEPAWPTLVPIDMRHVPVWYFVQVGIALDAVVRAGASDDSDATLKALREAVGYLQWLAELHDDFPLELYAVRPQIGRLWRDMQEILRAPADKQQQLVSERREAISASTRELIPTLSADLGKEPIFLILQKRAYSTRTLILDGPRFSRRKRETL